jgi:hypothetical protein
MNILTSRFVAGLFLGFFALSNFSQAKDNLKPLNISLQKFRTYADKKLTHTFGKLTEPKQVWAVDGWVNLDHDTRPYADHAAVIYTATLPGKFAGFTKPRVAIVLGASGEENIYYLLSDDLKKGTWMPYAWELIVNPKSVDQATKIVKEYKKKYPAVTLQLLEAIGIITFSTTTVEDGVISKSEMKQILAISNDLQKDIRLKSVEPSFVSYRIPSQFSNIINLDSLSQSAFDLNEFRTVTKEMVLQGDLLTTQPAFKPPFGIGPISNIPSR